MQVEKKKFLTKGKENHAGLLSPSRVTVTSISTSGCLLSVPSVKVRSPVLCVLLRSSVICHTNRDGSCINHPSTQGSLIAFEHTHTHKHSSSIIAATTSTQTLQTNTDTVSVQTVWSEGLSVEQSCLCAVCRQKKHLTARWTKHWE